MAKRRGRCAPARPALQVSTLLFAGSGIRAPEISELGDLSTQIPNLRSRPRAPHEHRVDLADSEELGMFSFFGDFGLEKVGFFQVVAPAPAHCFGRRIMPSVAAWARKYWILVAWYLAS